jgi:hypothetical protein
MAAKQAETVAQFKDDIETGGFEMTVVRTGGGDNWAWADVRLDDHDQVGCSEVAGDVAREHGFRFCAVDGDVVRFNKKLD